MTKPLKIKHFTSADKLRAFGDEIVIQELRSEYDLVKMFNWYNANIESKDGLPWILEYMADDGWTKEQIHAVEKTDLDLVSPTVMWLCRIANNGTGLFPKNYAFIKNHLTEVCGKFRANDGAPVFSLAEKTAERIRNIIGDIEEQIDTVGLNFKLFEFLKAREIPTVYISRILDFYMPVYKEYLALKAGKDKSLKEGYRGVGKVKIEARLGFYSSIVQDCKAFEVTKKVTRKPRKVKAKSVESLVLKLNYQKESPEFKVASINPIGIFKAQSLWVFNTKLRKLGVYHAEKGKTLSVKGSTLQNFDPETSLQKTIRKPEFVLPKILGAGKVYLRNQAMNDIRAVESKLTGRLNRETIILKKVE